MLPLKGAIERFGLLLTIPLLITAAISAVKDLKRRKLLARQNELEDLKKLTWQEFEVLVAEAFRRDGYEVRETGQGGADGGIDLILKKTGETSIVQCKSWKDRQVGVKPIRELFGVMVSEEADDAIFVTSGGYTAEAMIFAKGKPMTLIDGGQLLALIKTVLDEGEGNERDVGSAIQDAVPACPSCGKAMVKRQARRGANQGQEFWGCSEFPKCRGTRDA